MPALRRAADALGSSRAQFARRIYAPLLLRRSLPLLLLYAVYIFGTYEIPLLLGRSSPRVVTIFVTEQLQRFDLSNIPLGHAMAVLYTALVAVLLALLLSRRTGQIRET
jgi:putative spermidine/putrescine transport system permease protein